MCENIIGLTRQEDNCLGIEYTQSKSGLYLDDTTEGRLPLSPSFFLDRNDDIAAFLKQVIADSFTETKDILYQEIATNYFMEKSSNFVCPKRMNGNSRLSAGTWYFMAIKPYYRRGGYIRIDKVVIETASSFKIIDESLETLYDGTINDFQPMTLQMDQCYFIAYQSESRPYNHKYVCCNKQPEWLRYMKGGGGSVSDLADLEWKQSEYSHGVQIHGYGSCDPLWNLCDLDFKTDGYARVFARLLLMVTRKNLAEWMVNSDLVSPYILTNREDIQALITYYNAEIKDRREFLPTVNHNSDCYQCGASMMGSIIT